MSQDLIACINRGEEEQELVLAEKSYLALASFIGLSLLNAPLVLLCQHLCQHEMYLRLEHNLHLSCPCLEVSNLNLALQDLLYGCFSPECFCFVTNVTQK